MSVADNDKKITRMKELAGILTNASRVYYAEDREIMSNYEYDKLYDELVSLEEDTGIVLAGSPTQRVGYEAVDNLPKEKHASPMLSLGKTKERAELADWLGDKEGLLSWKLDGLTVVLTYENGELSKAVTRGNGEVGEVITANARTFINLPLRIPYKERLVLRGEAVISYPDFEKINSAITDADEKYKNPRNLCSGSVRQLDSSVTAKRSVRLIAFNLVSAGEEAEGSKLSTGGKDFDPNLASERFAFLDALGFETVQRMKVNASNVVDAVGDYEKRIADYEIPSDGLVLTYEDIAYGRSLGSTAKFPRHSIAFKWSDELAETTLREIEWSASRTGLINPVAIFDTVELEGTSVSRASVHNVSIVKELQLGIGDRITVYKANMIIPQIAENLTRSGKLQIPKVCPVCGGTTEVRAQNEAESLFCTNPECPAKQIKLFTQFVSRNAMNIDGLSEMTLEKFVDCGFIKEFADIYKLDRFKERIVRMEGFGEKSYENLIASIDKSRNTTLSRVLFGLGIAGVGSANAKLICRAFKDDLDGLRAAKPDELTAIDGVGDVMSNAICEYFADDVKSACLDRLIAEVTIDKTAAETAGDENSAGLDGLSFVVTGSLEHFKSRNDLKDLIEARGGKVTGSVTGKTECLINNDFASQSSKNKTAKSLGVAILSEDDFLAKYMPDYKY